MQCGVANTATPKLSICGHFQVFGGPRPALGRAGDIIGKRDTGYRRLSFNPRRPLRRRRLLMNTSEVTNGKVGTSPRETGRGGDSARKSWGKSRQQRSPWRRPSSPAKKCPWMSVVTDTGAPCKRTWPCVRPSWSIGGSGYIFFWNDWAGPAQTWLRTTRHNKWLCT